MIEPRIYRAAFVPAVIALVLTAFSLQNRPAPAPQGLAADVLFEGRLAAQTMRQIVSQNPDRSPGSVGNQRVADEVGRRLARNGFETKKFTFEADGRMLTNVVARRTGASRKQIVVMADRDSDSVPDATGSASDTATLLELGRVFQGRATRRTLVLVSTDGGSLGDAGALRFAETAPDRDQIEAVLAFSDTGVRRPDGSLTVQWSNDSRRGSIGLARTASSSLRQEIDDLPDNAGPLAQLMRLAFPIGIGDQGVLLENGLQAIRISGSGELPPSPSESQLEDVDVERLGALGRGILRTASALDGARTPDPGPSAYILTRKVLPGWTIALLAITLLFPALVASIDALARARRRKEVLGRWWRWIGLAVLPFLVALAVAELLVAFGAAPDVSSGAASPDANPFDGAAAGVLAGVFVAALATWLISRWRTRRSKGARQRSRTPRAAGLDRAAPAPMPGADASQMGAACATSLALVVMAIAIWFVNPFAAFLMVPACHLWMLAMLSDRGVGAISAVLVVIAGLLPWALVAIYYTAQFELNPLSAAWYLFLLVTGHQVGLPTALLACVALGLVASTVAVLFAKARGARAPRQRDRAPITGPAGYTGPGSLGGTESAMRRGPGGPHRP